MKRNFLSVLAIMSVASVLVSCGSRGDNSAENWIIAILLILCWLKGGGK